MVFGLEFWALTSEFSGKILIALAVLMVHYKIRQDKKIDKKVLKEMGLEMLLGIFGIVLLLVGYVLHLVIIY